MKCRSYLHSDAHAAERQPALVQQEGCVGEVQRFRALEAEAVRDAHPDRAARREGFRGPHSKADTPRPSVATAAAASTF